jgi:hypothetical protein
MRILASIILVVILCGCAGYEHHKIRAEQERQLQEQRESAELIDSQMPADQRRVLDDVAAAEEGRKQAAIESRKRQVQSTTIPDTGGVNNQNHPVEDVVHGAAWWVGSDAVKGGVGVKFKGPPIRRY